MIDLPFTIRVIEGDAHGAGRSALPEGTLVLLAQEVIQRLAHWAHETDGSREGASRSAAGAAVDTLCAALVGLEPEAAMRLILAAHRDGATHEELCIDHVGAAARQLGLMVEREAVSYGQMTLAAGRMLTLLRALRDLAPPVEPRRGRCALFATVPGERHVLGVTMAADLFRDEGWDIDLRLGTTEAQLVDLVRGGAYPIVGLSAAGVDGIGPLARTIVALRVATPRLLIFVGGPIAQLDPDIAHRVGADAAGAGMAASRTAMERLHGMVPGLSRLN